MTIDKLRSIPMDGSYMWPQLGKKLLVGAFVLVLAACGGGGSSGTTTGGGTTTLSSNTPPPSTPLSTATATYTVSWAATNDPNVTGYRVYYSVAPLSSSGSPGHVDVNNISTTAIDFQPAAYGIARGVTLHVAVSSTGTGGLESPTSPEVSILVE